MLIKIIYGCEICGERSEDSEVIKRCEARGIEAKHREGERVVFLYIIIRGTKRWEIPLAGKIVEVTNFRNSHKVLYKIIAFPGQGLPEEIPGFFFRKQIEENLHEIAEEDIIENSGGDKDA